MKKGFTLLEILLVIAAIGILAAVVIVAINPNRQLAQVRDASRKSDVNSLFKALTQYFIDNDNYPSGVTSEATVICDTGGNTLGEGSVNSGCVDLRSLVPAYMAAIPFDPQNNQVETGYLVWVNSNSNLALAATGEETDEIGLNHIAVEDNREVHYNLSRDDSYTGTGSTLFDISGNDLHANLVNNPSFVQSSPQHIDLNGSNNRVDILSSDNLSITGSQSVEMILSFDSITGSPFMYSRFTTGYNETFKFGLTGAGELEIRLVNGNLTRGTGFTPEINTWYHIIISYDQNFVTTYINGVEIDQVNYSTSIPSSTGGFSLVGADRDGGSDYNQHMDGKLGLLSVYSKSLTANEVLQNYELYDQQFDL